MISKTLNKVSRFCLGIVACSVAYSIPAMSYAADYPVRPITFVVPYSPGGLPDTVARVVADGLSKSLKQSVVVENKPGANGVVAANTIKTSPADGYTFLVTDGSMISINPHIYKNLSYDPFKDFVPVSLIATSPLFLAVHSSLNITTLQQFIDLVKANPDKYSYGSSGIGSTHHLAMEALKADLGLEMTHVPYRGSSQSIPALVGNQVQFAFAALPSLKGFVEQGKVKILASNALERNELAKDIPTISEVIPGYDFAVSVGILARVGTPDAAVQKISAAVTELSKTPEFKQSMGTLGIVAVGGDAKTYGANTREESNRYVKAIEHAKISIDSK